MYEADRKNTRTKRHNKKLRAHFHYIVKHKLHIKDYHIPSIRAVLIETLDNHNAELLRQAAKHPVVSGKPSSLFWFTSSEIFAREIEVTEEGRVRLMPEFLYKPEAVLSAIWLTPKDDEENPVFKSLWD